MQPPNKSPVKINDSKKILPFSFFAKIWMIISISSIVALFVLIAGVFVFVIFNMKNINARRMYLTPSYLAGFVSQMGVNKVFSPEGKQWLDAVYFPLIHDYWVNSGLNNDPGLDWGYVWLFDPDKNLVEYKSLKGDNPPDWTFELIREELRKNPDSEFKIELHDGIQLESALIGKNVNEHGYIGYIMQSSNANYFSIALPYFLSTMPPVIILCFICGIFSSLAAAYYVRKRVQGMSKVVEGLFSGVFSMKCNDNGRDELSLLASRINLLSSRLPGFLADHEAVGAQVEKNRFGRELHDNIKQDLFALTLMAGALKNRPVEEIYGSDSILRLEQGLKTVMDNVQKLIKAVLPVQVSAHDLPRFLQDCLNLWKGTENEFRLDMHIDEHILNDHEATEIYWICREAFANTARHSGADQAMLQIKQNGTSVSLSYKDNGRGYSPDMIRGFGLSQINLRVKNLKGEMTISNFSGACMNIVWDKG